MDTKREKKPDIVAALYFPHTEMRSIGLLRAALLTWDYVDCIVPQETYRSYYESRIMARAMEIIGRARTPTDAEKARVHSLVEELLTSGVPETFRYSPSDISTFHPYEVWPQKLAPKTWDLLEASGLTSGPLVNADYPMSQAAGLTLMSILADVLAGESRARITDRGMAYATIANAPQIQETGEAAMRVIPLTLRGVNMKKVSTKRLIEFRTLEGKDSGYRTLRHNYLAAIRKHAEEMSGVSNESDRKEFDRQFAQRMEDDHSDLKKELGFAKRDAWLSKDLVTIALGAGSAVLSLPGVLTGAGAAAAIGGVLGTGNRYAKARYDILRKHPMAYLYQVAR